MLDPTLPEVGDSFSLFGISGKVAYVEPHSDYVWSVEVEVRNASGYVEGMTILVPTDFRIN